MATNISPRVQQKLDEWKRSLLLGDGRGNSLLSLRSSTHMLRIREPDAGSVFDLLSRQRALTISLPSEAGDSLDLLDSTLADDVADGQSRLLTGAPALYAPKRRIAESLVLEADAKKLPSILYRLRLKVQTALNERGVNVLFVAFGQLNWREADDSSETIRSPLVLVPVELSRETLRDPYRLKMLDEEMVLNPVLIERLRKDFEIDLGVDADELADLTLEGVCRRIQPAIVRKRGWNVDDTVAYLGMFSFLKMSMYKELESAAPIAAQSVVIQSLSGEKVALPSPEGVPGAHELDDRVPPGESFHILDADSSQLEAIVYVKAGGNLIIQGPPGTGKSQTIANIIAECLAVNKTILFVSEKMAALEVVYQRLEKVGLADFCLEAHSQKANKREIIRKLGAALDGREASSTDGRATEILTSLAATRERLNLYVRALHARDNPLGRSVYEVQGEVAVRDDTPLLPFAYAGIATLTQSDLASIRECVHDLEKCAHVLVVDDEHPWHRCTATDYSFQLRDQIVHQLNSLRDHLQVVTGPAREVAEELGVSAPANLADLRSFATFLQRIRETRLPLDSWQVGLPSMEPVAWLNAVSRQTTKEPEQLRPRSFIQGFINPLSRETPMKLEGLRKQRRDRVIAALRMEAEAPSEHATDVDTARAALVKTLSTLQAEVARVRIAQAELQTWLGISNSPTLDGALATVALAELLLHNPYAQRGWFDPAVLARATDLAREASEHARVWNDDGCAVRGVFDVGIFDLAPEMLTRFTQNYGGFLRFLKPGFRRDMKSLRRLTLAKRKLGYGDALDELKRATRIAASRAWLQDHHDELARVFGMRFVGIETDWAEIQKSLDTTRSIILNAGPGPLPARLVELAIRDGAKAQLGAAYQVLVETIPAVSDYLADAAKMLPWSSAALSNMNLDDLETLADIVRAELVQMHAAEEAVYSAVTASQALSFQRTLDAITRELAFLGTIFDLYQSTDQGPLRVDGQILWEASPDAVVRWVTVRLEHIDELDDWIGYRNALRKARQVGLGELIPVLRTTRSTADTWSDGVLRYLYRLWLDHQYAKYPALNEFRGELHSDIVKRFQESDRAAVRAAARRVRDKLLARGPHVNGAASDHSEPGILRREVAKQRRHKPLRRLFGEIPTLLLRLTPCLMMSPLSLSQYLDPERIRFDVVIFDEASQIRPEDAAGALMRGAQLVVAGDEHQLPPSSFFSSLAPDSGEDWDEDTPEVYESILDACQSAGLASRMLRWHYRSRDETLIAFSNRFIYDGRLVTFPSAHPGHSDYGVHLVYVAEGVYDRSATRTNPIEAGRVVDLIFERAERYVRRTDRRSVGVVAFSEAQMLAILQILEKRRQERPDLDPFFLERGEDERFFVKNLENVQGDERDVMLFSIGYGPDAAGRVTMNFGPLNRSGGQRRLNVAITRARDQVVVVSSITGDDIDSNVKAEGVRLLKLYLDYAEKGSIVLAQGQQKVVGDYESPFEEAVAQALQRKGLIVQSQVGCAGFRIDLGIVHPEKPGRYVLGIECDGATYHRQATARDRDRLRQQVLEGLGWRVHRIWSRDWVKAPVREIERVLEVYQRALVAETSVPSTAEAGLPPSAQGLYVPLRPSPPPSSHPVAPLQPIPRAKPYRAVILPIQGAKAGFYETPVTAFLDPIVRCVREEGPIPIHVMRQRVAACWKIERVGTNVAKRLDDALALATKRGLIVRKVDFLWPAEMTVPPVRASGDGADYRAIGDVCPEEIDAAILLVIGNDFACARENLVVSTSRLLGYDRAKQQVAERIGERIKALQESGKLGGNADQVCLPSIRQSAGA